MRGKEGGGVDSWTTLHVLRGGRIFPREKTHTGSFIGSIRAFHFTCVTEKRGRYRFFSRSILVYNIFFSNFLDFGDGNLVVQWLL